MEPLVLKAVDSRTSAINDAYPLILKRVRNKT